MNTQRLIDKLTSWPVTLTVCLLIVLGTLTVKLWPRTVPFDQCSVAYQTYASQPGIRAAFIKDYRINDTVKVNVTLLEAKTDSAWALLQHDFKIPKIDSSPLAFLAHKDQMVLSFLASKHLPDCRHILGNSVLAFSYSQKTVCIFHTESHQQQYDVLHYNLNKSINQKH